MTIIIGVDPGLVHTGVVVMYFEDGNLVIDDFVIETIYYEDQDKDLVPNLEQVAGAVATIVNLRPAAHVFIEAYRPRGNAYSTDPKMTKLMGYLAQHVKRGKVIDNTGVKQVVKTPLMKLLGCWNFSQPTHHQDLRSAARIALYGALKDEELNKVIYDYVVTRVP